MPRHKKKVNFDPHTKIKFFLTTLSSIPHTEKYVAISFDHSHKNLPVAKFDSPLKNKVNFDPTLKTSQLPSPL